MITVIFLSLIGTSPAWAENLHISIISPTPNSVFYNNTVTVSGTWSDDNSTSSPTLSVGAIDQGMNGPSVSGNTWTINLSNLNPGWHTIEAIISDQTTTRQVDSVQVIIITGHQNQPRFNILFVKESNTCLALLKSNSKSGCPTLGTLNQWDTSNQKIAGKIVQLPNGQWTRTKPMLAQWWNFVNQTGLPVVCVECDFDYSQIARAQIIFVDPHGFKFPTLNAVQYQNQTESYWNGTMYLNRIVQQQTTASTTLTINSDRYHSPDCTSSEIGYSPQMMADTIAFMDSNCVKTNLILNSTIVVPQIPFDFAHSTWYHGEKWLENVTSSIATQNCQEGCKNIASDPYHNKGFGWN